MAKKTLIKEIINAESGELLNTEATQINTRIDDEPDYVKFYIRAWCDFKNIKGINTNFLYQLLPFMTFAEKRQIISVGPFLKKEIAAELGWSEKTSLNRVAKEFKKLCNAGVLKQLDTCSFQVNPELIGRGSWKDIKRLRATFDLSNGTITHNYVPDFVKN